MIPRREPDVTTITAIIPARYDSTRFPGKALADRTGRPLIQHVYEQAARCSLIDRVVVATDDARIFQAVEGFGGQAIMTRADHPNGTSRIAEAAESIDADIIVNLQGDEPQLEPSLIDLTVRALLDHPEAPMATLASSFAADEDPADPNIVKIVIDSNGMAKCFTRSLAKASEVQGGTGPFKHIGLYVYRHEFLRIYMTLESTAEETAERLEQLRVLGHGYDIVVARGEVHHHGIDTPEQYDEFVAAYQAETS